MRNIAFIGKRGSGKSTLTRLLVTRGWQRISWADPVRLIASMAYDHRFTGSPAGYAAAKASLYAVRLPDGTTTRITGTTLLQRIGTEGLRNGVDQDIWVKIGLRAIAESEMVPAWVNDDTRFPNEIAAVTEAGWLVIGLQIDEDERIRRLIARDGMYDEAAQSHASENSLTLSMADRIIDATRPLPLVLDDILALADGLAG